MIIQVELIFIKTEEVIFKYAAFSALSSLSFFKVLKKINSCNSKHYFRNLVLAKICVHKKALI